MFCLTLSVQNKIILIFNFYEQNFHFLLVFFPGLKNTVFDECLLRDTWLMSLGSLFVLICMWLYTGSLFITLMTVIAIGFSLGISYFIYTLIFELHFFPFMNLLASIVAIGKCIIINIYYFNIEFILL